MLFGRSILLICCKSCLNAVIHSEVILTTVDLPPRTILFFLNAGRQADRQTYRRVPAFDIGPGGMAKYLRGISNASGSLSYGC